MALDGNLAGFHGGGEVRAVKVCPSLAEMELVVVGGGGKEGSKLGPVRCGEFQKSP